MPDEPQSESGRPAEGSPPSAAPSATPPATAPKWWTYGKYAFAAFAGLAATIGNWKTIHEFFWPTAPPPPPPELAITYRRIVGQDVVDLLNNRFTEKMRDDFGKPLFVVKNEVWEASRKLVAAMVDKEEGEGWSNIPAVVWSEKDFNTYVAKGPTSITDAFKNWGLTLTDDPDTVEGLKAGTVNMEAVAFDRTLDCHQLIDNLVENYEHWGELYSTMTKDYCPAQFATVTSGVEACSWDNSILVPVLTLEIAVVQNVSNHALTLSALEIKRDRRQALRDSAEETSLAEPGTIPMGGYPLRAGDAAILLEAIRLDLTYPGEWEQGRAPLEGEEEVEKPLAAAIEGAGDSADAGEPAEVPPPTQEQLMAMVAANKTILLTDTPELAFEPGTENPQDHTDKKIPSALMVAAMKRSVAEVEEDGSWVYGPVNRLVAATGPQIARVTRDRTTFGNFVSDRGDFGSCPYLLARYGRASGFVDHGKFLVDASKPGVDGMDRVRLKSWPAALRVEERDPETTFLRRLEVVCEVNGSEHVHEALPDAGYTPLKRGESASYDIPSLDPGVGCESVYARVRGHYVEDVPEKVKR